MLNLKEQLETGNMEVIGKGNYDFIEELFTTDYIAHAGGKVYKGHEFIHRFIKLLRTAIPDIHVIKIEILAQSGNTVTWQRTLTGTHMADMMGAKATHQNLRWQDMMVSRFEGNKIAEEWTVSELAGEMLSKYSVS
ncbi:MAG: hypothetical protein DWQ10_10810 [Calditrichaeota bacterium]|nr:MAG: hypothetical protein DWQ10_10810 [Calditrichota bacterium]